MSVKIDQALITSFIAGNFGLPIAQENYTYTPGTGTAYAELTVFQSDTRAAALKGWDEVIGIFQIILRFPPNAGAIPAKTAAEAILSHFKLHSRHTYQDQAVEITRHSRGPGAAEDGWYKIVVRLNYRAFTPR